MTHTCITCSSLIESFANTMDVGNIVPITNQVGLAWAQVNQLNVIWSELPDSIRMDILYTVVHELKHHTGTLFDLSTRTISALSMSNYDGSGIGPVLGGLNSEHLSPSNPFGNTGVSFPQAKSPLMEFATERFKACRLGLNREVLDAYSECLGDPANRTRDAKVMHLSSKYKYGV